MAEIHYPNTMDFQYREVKRYGRFYDFRTLRYISAVARIISPRVVYDVGTCFANHALYFGKVLGCHVECFEPNTNLLPFIERTMKGANVSWNLHNVALGDCEGVGATVEVSANLGSSKFNASAHPLGSEAAARVKLTKLDELAYLKGLDDPQIIKIDTEGYECKVLRGAQKILDRAGPEIFIEISPENKPEALNLLEQLGYRRVHFAPGLNYHYSRNVGSITRVMLNLQRILIEAQTSVIKSAVKAVRRP